MPDYIDVDKIKCTFHDKNITTGMKDLAELYVGESTNISCVSVAVCLRGDQALKNGRSQDASSTIDAYVCFSGNPGRKLLAKNFDGPYQKYLEDMAKHIVKYRSSHVGASIIRVENWQTHNCAESNLTAYLMAKGKSFSRKKYYNVCILDHLFLKIYH